MKNSIQKLFNLVGLQVSRFHGAPQNSYALKVGDPVEFNSKENLELLYTDKENLKHHQFSEERIKFYKEILNQLTKENIVLEGKLVADVGCGTGQLLQLIAESNKTKRLSGYEYSEEAIKVAKQKVPGANFFQYDIYTTSPDQFDVVLCSEVLEHLLYPWKALDNIAAMLLPGGTLIITVPNGRKDQWDGHINFWSPESWKSFLEHQLLSNKFQVLTKLFEPSSLMGIIKKIN